MKHKSELDKVAAFICACYEVDLKGLRKQCRSILLTNARAAFCYLSKFYVNDFDDIAEYLVRNRPTIYKIHKDVLNSIKDDKIYKNYYTQLKEDFELWKSTK